MILRIILGDQLNPNHSWFKEKNQENRTNQIPGSYCTRMADLYSSFAS